MHYQNSKTNILPFNLDIEDYRAMPVHSYSHQAIAMIYLMRSPMDDFIRFARKEPDVKFEERISQLRRLVDLLNDSNWPFSGRAIVDWAERPCEWTLWNERLPEQIRWTYNGIYVQVGFRVADTCLPRQIDEMIANSMFLHDMLVCRHKSTDPRDHTPLELRSKKIRVISTSMGNVYQNGFAFYPKEAYEYRDKLAVMARAIIAGKDPFDEYQLFLQDDVDCFLGVENSDGEHVKDFYVTTREAYGWDAADEEDNESGDVLV